MYRITLKHEHLNYYLENSFKIIEYVIVRRLVRINIYNVFKGIAPKVKQLELEINKMSCPKNPWLINQ